MASNNQGNKQQGSGTSNRGFASMDPQRQREIASEGGKAAHEKGTAHEFTSEEARRAGSMSHGNRQAAQASSKAGGGSSKQGGKQSDNKQSDSKQSDSKQGGKQGGQGNKQSDQGGSRGGKSDSNKSR